MYRYSLVRRLLHLNAADNVAMAPSDLAARDEVRLDGRSLVLLDDVPAGHKVAIVDIQPGESILKYGVNIGTAVELIRSGNHVHVHNVESERMRGDRG